MIVIGGSASNGIDERLAKILKLKHAKIERKDFPDGEFKVRVPIDVKRKDVLLVQSISPPQDHNLVELLFLLDALRELDAERIFLVSPYLGYMRQNRMFEEGEGVSAKAVMDMLNQYEVHGLVVVEPHKRDPLDAFRGEVAVVDPVRPLAEGIGARDRQVVISPDEGGVGLAERLSEELECEHDHIDKERDLKTGEVRIVGTPKIDLRGKEVILSDDIISTGGTIAQAAAFAKGRGAKKVIALGVHLVMADGALQKLKGSGVSRIFGSNTIHCNGVDEIDISGEIANSVKEITEI